LTRVTQKLAKPQRRKLFLPPGEKIFPRHFFS
jgi:hypothetical protein